MGAPASATGQSAEEIYRLVYGAAVQHRPIAALCDGKPRLLCPHVLGCNQPGEWRVFLLSLRRRNQERTTAGWECGNLAVSIAEEILSRGVVGRSLAKRTSRSPTLCGEH
jgi:hypothetical protein